MEKVSGGPMTWYRTGSDVFAGGDAYRDRALLNGQTRDFAMTVSGIPTNSVSSPSGECLVDGNDMRQRMDGFGGGVVFLTPGSLDPVTDANMDTLFGSANASQLGLSLLRVRIDPNSNWSNALSDARKAITRGAKILATPWSPPAAMKDNTNTIGGSLLPAQYANYAAYLNNFAAYLATNGAPLAVISVQNEPDVTVTYESCHWTATQLQTFFHDNAAAITNAPVMMPESFQFNFALSDLTLNDATAAANVDIVGGHLYGASIQDYVNAHAKGKPTWMTEYLVNDQTWSAAFDTAQQIHECLTVGNMSAYIWWKCLGDTNGLVDASGVPQKRGFVMAQFSRFVPPGYYRIGATNSGNALITAFRDTNSGSFAIVAMNTDASNNTSQTFDLTNFATVATVTPWITSATLSLANQPAVTVSNASFTYALPAQSVVTFVGQANAVASNTAPILQPVADQTINAGVTLTITNVATDPDVPPQILAFSLLNAPLGAALTNLDATSALFTWRPPVNQANTTNLVVVQVADDGTPSLKATNHFNVIVNPIAQPALSLTNANGGNVSLVVNGPLGPDYTLWTSTNLTSWQALFTTNSPVTPVTLVDTNASADPVRFYRIQLGP
jgi:glucuronoarabinoxylan endo-1,4-beta-xylanase